MRASTSRQILQELVRDHGRTFPLDLAVACVAADEQVGLEIAGQLTELDSLASRISLRTDAPLFESIARLHMALFDELGFQGDEEDYGHPRNSYLNLVMERRRGMPIL